jgi:hypothetical protein
MWDGRCGMVDVGCQSDEFDISANSCFEVLSDCNQIQNFGHTFLASLLFA